MRNVLLIFHRWAGLTITLALVVTGLTGAILPFRGELRDWLAPDIWNVEQPAPDVELLSGLDLVKRVEQQTGGNVSYFKLTSDPEHAQSIFVSANPDGPPLDYSQVFVDPYTGDIRAKVRFADLSDGAINIMPFLVSFHYSLAGGNWGRWILGVAALIWCLECFAGFYLALPRRSAGGLRDTLRRWAPAWMIRRKQGSQAFTYDLHRASGLWLWPMMLVFAWSGVAFNLDAVHEPVQRFLGGQGLYLPVENPDPASGEVMSREMAVATGARLMEQEAQRQGFDIRGPEALSLRPYADVTGYYARTSLDGPTGNGSTVVWFDQVSGRQVDFVRPFGNTNADFVDKSLRMLHTGSFFGWPYKIAVSLFGLLTAAMSIAGCVMWYSRTRKRWRKRRARGAA